MRTLTAASLTFTRTIDGVLAGSLAAAGISYNGSTFSFNGNVGAYDHLAAGAHATVVVSFTASDGSLTSNVGSVTFVVDGTNDARWSPANGGRVGFDAGCSGECDGR